MNSTSSVYLRVHTILGSCLTERLIAYTAVSFLRFCISKTSRGGKVRVLGAKHIFFNLFQEARPSCEHGSQTPFFVAQYVTYRVVRLLTYADATLFGEVLKSCARVRAHSFCATREIMLCSGGAYAAPRIMSTATRRSARCDLTFTAYQVRQW